MSTMKFTAWQDLDGNEIANAAYPPGLVLVKSQTIGTAVSSVTVSDVFSSAFDNYRIVITNIIGSLDRAVQMRLGSTSANYDQVGYYQTWNTSTVVDYAPATPTYWDSVSRCTTGGSNHCVIELFNPYLSQNTHGHSRGMGLQSAEYIIDNNLWLNDTNSYTSFLLFPYQGTMTGGTIKVYGYRN